MNKLVSISYKVGFVNSLFLIIYFLTIYFLGNVGVLDNMKFFDFWMPAVFIFIALKFYRDKINNHELRMWQGLAMGVQITAINALILGGFVALFLTYIDPDYLDKSIHLFQEQLANFKSQYMHDNHLSIEDFNRQNPKNFAETYAQSLNVTTTAVVQDKMMTVSFFGILYSFILSIFLRKNAA